MRRGLRPWLRPSRVLTDLRRRAGQGRGACQHPQEGRHEAEHAGRGRRPLRPVWPSDQGVDFSRIYATSVEEWAENRGRVSADLPTPPRQTPAAARRSNLDDARETPRQGRPRHARGQRRRRGASRRRPRRARWLAGCGSGTTTPGPAPPRPGCGQVRVGVDRAAGRGGAGPVRAGRQGLGPAWPPPRSVKLVPLFVVRTGLRATPCAPLRPWTAYSAQRQRCLALLPPPSPYPP